MDPVDVLRTLWKERYWALPVLLLTMVAGCYAYTFGPRTFETSASFAVIAPTLPSETDIAHNPRLGRLSNDNPYVRSSDPTLISDVLVTRMTAQDVPARLEKAGLSDEYTVGQSPTGAGFVIDLTGVASSPRVSRATTVRLGRMLVSELETMQKAHGANDRFLFTALTITPPAKAQERYSSRLRSVIMIALAGVVLTFAAVSAGRYLRSVRSRTAPGGTPSEGAGGHAPEPSRAEPRLARQPQSARRGRSVPPPDLAPGPVRWDPATARSDVVDG